MVYLVDFENVTSAGISGIQRLTKEDKVYIFYTVNAANMSFAAHLNLLSSPAEIIYYNVSSGGKNALDFQLSSFLGYLISQGEDKNFCIISNDKGFEHVKTFWERSGLAAGVSINGAPSINKSILPIEKPFTAKIQQGEQQPVIQPEKQSIEAESVVTEAVVQDVRSITDPEEIMEKKPKKRGRPKKKKDEAKPAEKAPAAEKPAAEKTTGTNKKNTESINSAVEMVKSLLAKAAVKDLAKIAEVVDLLRKSDGKQQFYRGIIKIFGMENGVVVYKVMRPEYTNLTKLAKQ
ncbi:MAG: hypothetical protein J1F11_02810 [Oscillospiraceae bacterium]|nr:hypothetical protein [Oscillospiraceae bacterium]